MQKIKIVKLYDDQCLIEKLKSINYRLKKIMKTIIILIM